MSEATRPQASADSIGARVAVGAASMLGRGALIDSLAVLASVVLARRLSVVEFGLYGTYTALVGIAGAWCTGAVAFYTRERRWAFGRASFRWVLIVNIAVGLALIATGVASGPGGLALAAGSAVYVASLAWRLERYVRIWRSVRFPAFAKAQMIEGVVLQGGSIVVVLLGGGLDALGAVLAVSGVLGTWATTTLARRIPDVLDADDPTASRPRWRLWSHDILQNVSEVAAQYAWVPAASFLVGSSVAGGVRFGALVATPAYSLVLFSVPPLYSGVSQLPEPDVARLSGRVLRIAAVPVLAYAFVASLAMPPLVPAVFGRQWVVYIPTAQLLLCAFSISAIAIVVRMLLQGAGYISDLWIAHLAATVVGVALMYPLGLDRGATGAAAAVLISQCAWLAILLRRAHRLWGGSLTGSASVIGLMLIGWSVSAILGAQPGGGIATEWLLAALVFALVPIAAGARILIGDVRHAGSVVGRIRP